jgi:hypothetical protein
MRVEIVPEAELVATPLGSRIGTALGVLALSFVTLALLVLVGLAIARARRTTEPRRQFARLVRSVRGAATRADPVLAELLSPALLGAAQAVRHRRLDPASPQGRRLVQSLEGLRAGLASRTSARRQAAERQVVDELALDLELALEAAAEASTSS